MFKIQATRLWVAFHQPHAHSIARLAEQLPVRDSPQQVVTRREFFFSGLTTVFPGIVSLISPVQAVYTGDEVNEILHPVYTEFNRWSDLREEGPEHALVAMDILQDIEVGPIVREWRETRFWTIMWGHHLETENGELVRRGSEPHARVESLHFRLYEPGWNRVAVGHARFGLRLAKYVDVQKVPLHIEHP